MKTRLNHKTLMGVIFIVGLILQSSTFAQAIAYYSATVKNTDNQPIENVTVNATGANTVSTDAEGKFLVSFTSLLPDTSGGNTTYASLTFSHPDYDTLNKVIFISDGDSILGGTITLNTKAPSKLVTVSGNVKYENDQPVQYGEVFFLNTNNSLKNVYTTTDEQGNYSTQIDTGSYYVRSKALYRQDAAWAYRYVYYDSSSNLAEANLLNVSSDITDLNFIHKDLQVGSISGKVIDAETLQPLQEVAVSVTSAPLTDSSLIGTDSNGNYSVNVFEGTYYLFAYKPAYQLLYYNQVPSIFDATPVTVNSDNLNVTGIDFSLPSQTDGTNSISGFVYDEDTGLPIANVYVYAVPIAGGNWTESKTVEKSTDDKKLLKTDNNGAYTLGNLRNGAYTILYHKDGYLSSFYGDKYAWEAASVINLTGNTNISNVNANLKPMESFGGEIAGSVNISNSGSTLSGTLVSAFNSSGDVIANTISEHDGSYLIPSLLNDNYTIKASKVGYQTSEYSQKVTIDLNNSPVIKNVDFSVVTTDVERTSNDIPKNFSLSQNYPNPFNPSTKIEFSVSRASQVSLKVYNILGKEITTLVSKYLEPGKYKVNFNASQLPSGVYVYKLTAGSFSNIKKMIFLK